MLSNLRPSTSELGQVWRTTAIRKFIHSSAIHRAPSRYSGSFFTRARPPQRLASRSLLLAFSATGGVALYLVSRPKANDVSDIFASPGLIPSPCPQAKEFNTHGPTVLYSPDEEGKTLAARLQNLFVNFIWEPILTARRFVHLFLIFIPVIASAPMLLVGNPEARFNGDRWGAVWWYDRLVVAMARAGPTFIKLAQWAASRADLFPTILCDRMGALHSSNAPHSIGHTRRVIERVFQRPFDDVFEEFDEIPIGVGAIAQVYRAVLHHGLIPPSYLNPKRSHSNNFNPATAAAVFAPHIIPQEAPPVPSAAVAIKILHPRVGKTIARDLSIMHFFASFITLLPGMEWISLPEEVEVFGRMMAEQLDLRHEANNLLTFEHNFVSRKMEVSFPRPLTQFTSNNVLIEEFENALPLKYFLKNGGGPYDRQIAELGLNAFLNMLLLDNFVHSDLHPGNIMIKFYKPSASDLLKNIMASLFKTSGSTSIPHEDVKMFGSKEETDSDRLVDRLRSVSKDRNQWLAELQDLSEEGYIPELVFLDTGLVTSLNAAHRRNFLDLFRAIAEFDGYRAGQLMVSRCRTPWLTIDPDTFALKMQHIVLNVKRKTFSLGQIKISDILRDVLLAVRTHHVKMEGDFVNTVISVLLLEGIGRQLDPNLDLFKSALPILRQLGRQMSTSETVESVTQLPSSNFGAYLKLWVWLEARSLAAAAIDNFDDLIRYDLLMPNV